MWFRLVILIMGFLLLNAIKAQDNILILGDSLSAGYGLKQEQNWVYLLQHRLSKKHSQYQIINESTSGDTTANGLNRLIDVLQQNRIKIAIIELGANDGLRGISLDYTRKNLEKIIQALQQKKIKILLLGMRIPPNYGKKYTRAFASVYPDLAKKYQLALVPFMLAGISGNRTFIQQDGLHPNAQAQALILENIWPTLKHMLKEK